MLQPARGDAHGCDNDAPDGSDQYLTAAMSGMVICMLLLATILVRSVGQAEPRGQIVIGSEQSQASTRTSLENDNRVTLDVGLRGSLP